MSKDKDKTPKEGIKLPICPHCGSIPIACKFPKDCKFEDLKK